MRQSGRTASEEDRALETYTQLIRAAGSASARLQRRVISPQRLTESQIGVLEALLHQGTLSHRDLGEVLAKTSGNVTMVVDNLERRCLVRRERNREDRRSVSVSLTPGGRRLIEEVLPKVVEGILDEMSSLSPSEQEELSRLCGKLRQEEERVEACE